MKYASSFGGPAADLSPRMHTPSRLFTISRWFTSAEFTSAYRHTASGLLSFVSLRRSAVDVVRAHKRSAGSLAAPALVVCAALSFALLEGCNARGETEHKGPPPTPVASYRVTQGVAAFYDEYPATVTALNQVEIRPQVSGYISEISFKEGQRVSKGARLYAIDQQQYKATYDQARANLNVAKANLVKAQQDADRYQELAKHDAVAQQVVDHALNDLESAKMQVEAVEANVKSVETNLRYSVITAPFDCTIGISLVKLGSAVTAGQTLLNTVSSNDPMVVDCSVDEKQIARFTKLLAQPSNGQDSIFTIVLPDQSVYSMPGRLSLMDRSVDPQTGTIRIRVAFPNPHNTLKAGLTCNLRVRNTSSTASILIPYRAVMEQMGEYFVFVINSGKVSQRRIDLGMTINDMVIVKNGLKSGDEIVTEGMQKLRENAPVAVAPPGGKTAG